MSATRHGLHLNPRRAVCALATSLAALAAVVAVGAAPAAASQPSTARPVSPGTGLPAGVTPKTTSRPRNASPAGAHLTYYGGHVVSNVQVTQVLYGSGTYTPEVQNTASPSIASFYGGVTNSSYFDWLSEYNTTVSGGTQQVIGRGSFVRQVQITPAPANSGTTVDDTHIQAELKAQVAAGHLPAPSANTMYAIYFPANVTITQGGSASGVQFCAYHGTTSSPELYYSVLPDFTTGGMTSGCGTGTRFQNETSVSSHELVETVTDAEVGLATVVGAPLAWYDSTNGEIGDICNAQQQAIVGGDGVSYTVQQEWSNAQNACVVRGVTAVNDFSLALSPTSLSVPAGSNGTSTVSTAVTSGSAGTVSLSATGAPAGVTVAFSPTSVTAGGSSTMTVTTAANAVPGTYPITVKGVEGSATHTASLSLTVRATNDFGISISPAALTVAAGSVGTSTVSTTVTAGSAGTVSLSATGAPSGVTASLSPASVTAGGTSTLSINAAANAPGGTSTITVKGTEGAATHSASLTLTVTNPSTGGGLTNGGFETGTLSGWTSTGSASVISGGAQTGTYSARVGATTPTGDSSISQTFTVPTGGTGVQFAYNVTCPDSITYDWATATLRDNTAAVTATVLPKTCVNPTSGWRVVSAPATAGHSYTLTLSNHDDNYPGDPTYTQYDSVAIVSGGGGGGTGITNGGFETGTLTGWTSGGAATSVRSPGHTGTYAAMLGASTPTNGDSTIAQTFTAPTGKTTLSVWYTMSCPDTVTYDWATVTLKDNTAGTTTTVLAKTCASSAWTQKTSAVTAAHSYTLTLVSHDDNYTGDPTYTLYDDVTLN